MLFASYLWSRLRGTWRMFLLTSKLSHSHASAEVLVVLPKPRTDILMDKDVGLLSQQNSSWICSRMPRVMLRFVLPSTVFLLSISLYNISFPSKLIGVSLNIFCRWKAWMSIHFTYLTSKSTKHKSRGVAHTVPMGESTVSFTIQIQW